MIDILRSELQAITLEPLVQHHPELVAELHDRHPHTISLVRDARGEPLSVLASCYEYALGLTEFEEYEEIRLCDFQDGQDRFIANSVFVRHLLEAGLLTERSAPSPGDLVLYFDGGEPGNEADYFAGCSLRTEVTVGG